VTIQKGSYMDERVESFPTWQIYPKLIQIFSQNKRIGHLDFYSCS